MLTDHWARTVLSQFADNSRVYVTSKAPEELRNVSLVKNLLTMPNQRALSMHLKIDIEFSKIVMQSGTKTSYNINCHVTPLLPLQPCKIKIFMQLVQEILDECYRQSCHAQKDGRIKLTTNIRKFPNITIVNDAKPMANDL